MKFNRSFIILTVLLGASIFAACYASYQANCPSCSNDSYPKNYPRTSEVYRPSYGPRRPALDYESNELSKRLPTEHFTFDPEEDGLTRR